MKHLFTLFLFFATVFSAHTQELGLQFGKSISNFQFRDSQGQELKGLRKADNFFMSVDYRQKIMLETFREKMHLNAGVGYNRYGSSGSDVVLDNYYSWEVTYVGVNLGLDYVFYRNRSLMVYVKALGSPEFLIHGTQNLNNHVYSLRGEEDFESPIVFVRLGLGGQFAISDEASVFVQYMGGKSFSFSGNAAKLNIIAHNVGFGILFKLIKDPYQTEWRGNRKKLKTPR